MKKETTMLLRATKLTKGRLEKQPDGSYLTYFKGQRYPVHGYPTEEGLLAAEALKKHVVADMRIVNALKWFIVPLSPLLLFFAGKIARVWLAEFGRYAETIANKFNVFSPAVLNLYRLTDVFPGAESRLTIFGFCVILEQDKAYRWQFQDIMMCVRKDQLILRPAKEMGRLVGLYLDRNKRNRYKNLSWLVKLFLWTQPSARQTIRAFAENTDFTKFNMDRYDLWGAAQSQKVYGYSYAFGGKTQEELIDIYNKL